MNTYVAVYLAGLAVCGLLSWLLVRSNKSEADASAYVVLAILSLGWPIIVVMGLAYSPLGMISAVKSERKRRKELARRWRSL